MFHLNKVVLFSGVHPVRRKEAFWRVHPVHGLGQALWLPAGTISKPFDAILQPDIVFVSASFFCFSVPVRPLWQLRRVESHLYREQLERCSFYAEAGVQGLTLKRFTRRMLRFELSWRCTPFQEDETSLQGALDLSIKVLAFAPNTWFNSFVLFYATFNNTCWWWTLDRHKLTLNQLNPRCWARPLTWRSSPPRRLSWRRSPGRGLEIMSTRSVWCKSRKLSTWWVFSGRTGRPRLKSFQQIRYELFISFQRPL